LTFNCDLDLELTHGQHGLCTLDGRTGIVRCLTSAGNFQTSLNESADARPDTGICFMSRTATVEKRRVFQKYILHLHRYFISKDQKHQHKLYILLEQLRMINMQRTIAIEIFAVLSKCGFHHNHCQSQPHSVLF